MTDIHDEDLPDRFALSRRGFLGAGAAGGAVLAAGGLFPSTAEAAVGTKLGKLNPHGTTLESTLLRGKPGPGGYRKMVAGRGEPHVRRKELLTTKPGKARGPRRGLIALGQFTDMHLVDAQSPARVEFLDRYADTGNELGIRLPFEGAYRPQEMLSAHIGESMVRAMNRIKRAPVTGLPLAFTITTGDNADNTQYNELRWQIDLLDGERVRPDSGDYTKYEGVADHASYDTHYWHPDGAPAGSPADTPTGTRGFPVMPGLLDACRRPFWAQGLRTPWLTVFGNHDGLVQGNVPSSAPVAALATGGTKVTGLAEGVSVLALAAGLMKNDPSALQTLFGGPSRQVTPDPDRKPLSRLETMQEYFTTTGTPVGHGYKKWNLQTGNAYYAFNKGPIRGIVLDTVNPYGGPEGSMDKAQLAWLTAELKAVSGRYLSKAGKVVRTRNANKLVVVFSHHTIATMTNATGEGRVLGPEVRDLLLRFPNVVLWVNGHTHRNAVVPHPRVHPKVHGGFWEVNTAAHIDWPQQARVVELVDNRNGTLSVYGTILDHAAPMSYGTNPSSPLELASLARELSANDWQRPAGDPGEDGARGGRGDRNVELLLPSPF